MFRNIKKIYADGFFHIFIGNLLIKMIAFVSSIFVVRFVSKQEYAYLAYADNLYSYVMLFSGLGLSSAILKYCNPQISKEENKFFLSIALKYGVIFQALLSVLLVVIVNIIDIPFPNAKPIILCMILYPPISQILTTVQCYIRSQLNNKLFANIGILQTVVLFIVSVSLTYFVGIRGVIYGRYVAMICAIVLGIRFVIKSIPRETEMGIVEPKRLKMFWKMSISLMLANLFSMIMPINEMFIINSVIKNEIVSANYKVAILIPLQLLLVVNSVVVYIFPKIAQISDNKRAAFILAIKAELIVLVVIVAICIVGYISTPTIIRLVYGNKYIDAVELSKMYWLVYGVNAGIRILPMNLLPAIGSTLFNSVSSIISCVLHAVILYALLPVWGIKGAAYALLIIYLGSGILYWLYMYVVCYRKDD